MSRSIVLWGRHHTDLGDVAVRTPAPGVAVALSRGAEPKTSHYVDPNEDAVAIAAGTRATLAVVADGHGGVEASEAVITAVGKRIANDPPPADLDDDALVELFYEAGTAAMEAALAELDYVVSSTTMALALVTPDRVQWASYGDSAVYAGDEEKIRRLGPAVHRYLGYPMTPEQVGEQLCHGRRERPAGLWVVLTSDGFTDFVDSAPERVVRDALGLGDPAAVAAALVRRAFEGGAGDNVAVACVAPPIST